MEVLESWGRVRKHAGAGNMIGERNAEGQAQETVRPDGEDGAEPGAAEQGERRRRPLPAPRTKTSSRKSKIVTSKATKPLFGFVSAACASSAALSFVCPSSDVLFMLVRVP